MASRVAVLGALAACSPPPAPWDGPPMTEPRAQLTVHDLVDGDLPPFVHTSFLARPAWADDDVQPFRGRLLIGAAQLVGDRPTWRTPYDGEHRFPAFQVDLVSHQGELLPVQTGRIDTRDGSDSLWDVMVGAGALWHEPDDGDWSRASLPVDLVDRVFNQVRSCVATFVVRGSEVGHVYVQCGQETADADDDQIGDHRAMVPAGTAPSRIDVPGVVAARARDRAARLPVRPLAEWDQDGALAEVFERPASTRAPTSAGAVLVDGTLYVHPPQTRFGPHPYPQEMHHGVYSVTKTLTATVAMLFLAERYGESVFDARVTDHVPELADRPGWQGVTFAHALDMATGTRGGESSELLFEPLVLASSTAEALAGIAALGDAPEAPGDAFRYATTHTFVLSVAMQRFVESREGAAVRLWDLVEAHVLAPIGAGGMEVLSTRDPDPADRIPLMGYGARPTLDQAAKIALLLANGGEHGGRPLLHRERTLEALGRTGTPGLRVDARTSYRHGIWRRSVRIGGCRTDLAVLQGHGGNHVLLFPSGVIALRFTDEHDEDVLPLARPVERLAPSCR